MIDQCIKFNTLAVFGLLKTPNGSDPRIQTNKEKLGDAKITTFVTIVLHTYACFCTLLFISKLIDFLSLQNGGATSL